MLRQTIEAMPPKELVAGGVYRHVRNPMYVGALAALAGEVLFFRSGWIALYGAGLWAALHAFAVLIEEPQLERRFGETYRRYKTTTPRWLPRLAPTWRCCYRRDRHAFGLARSVEAKHLGGHRAIARGTLEGDGERRAG
jgi:type IV secretory pathway TrbD component